MERQEKQFYKFGSFQIDVTNRLLMKGKDIVPLTPKSFDTLLVLVENSGHVVEKQELMQKVWPDIFVEEANLANNISALRRILGRDSDGHQYIQTIPRRGYLFVARVHETYKGEESQEDEVVEAKTKTIILRGWQDIAVVLVVFAIAAALVILYPWDSCRPTEKPSVTVNSAGEWIAVVPVIKEGVTLEKDGLKLELQEGDEIIVSATGEVDIGRGKFGPDGPPNISDNTMDSPIKNHVGGLEMWIGANKNLKHYFIGSEPNKSIKIEESGVPTFRVIESIYGYCDKNNNGAFTVTIRKAIKNEKNGKS